MPRRVVIAGGGVAALEAAVALRRLGGDAVSPVLVAPNDDFSFRAREVGEPFGKPSSLRVPLAEMLEDLSIRFVHDRLAAVDPERRLVRTVDGSELPYDELLVAIGGTPFPAFAHGISFDRGEDPDVFDELLADVEAELVGDVAFVVPDAAGWALPAYDLALILRAWGRRHEIEPGIRIVTAESAPLDCFGTRASRAVARVLDQADVRVICGSEPLLITDTAMTAAGRWITADRIVALPRLAGPRVRGLPSDANGFLAVGGDGAVPGCPGVFGAGDGTARERKQGGLAAQQADRAARAMLRMAGQHVPEPANPPLLRGALATSEGPLYLEASVGYGAPGASSTASFHPLWDPPGKVATCWLGPFLETLVQRRLSALTA